MDAVAYPSPVGGRQGEPERTHSNGGFRKNEVFPFLLMGSDTFYADIRYSVNMEVPVYYCIGNHDLVKGKYGEELFESIYGPVYYSFDAGNTHYIVTPMWVGDYRPGYTKEDVYHWLKNDLAQIPEGKPIVVFSHDYWTSGDRHVFSAGKGMDIDLDAHNLTCSH